MKRQHAFCDHVTRRSFLRIGAASALGASFSLGQLLRAETALKAAGTADAARNS
jgi:uridine phosphorylase